MVFEDKESRSRSFHPARLEDSVDVHPVDVVRHGLQARAPVGVVVGRVGAGGARLHVLALITSRGLSRRLGSTAGFTCGVLLLVVVDWHLDADCLYWQLLTLLHLARTFVVQRALALLAGPLQLSREEPHIVVRLEAVAACEDVKRHLRGGEPEAAARHRGKPDTDSPSTASEVLARPAPLCQRPPLAISAALTEYLTGLLLCSPLSCCSRRCVPASIDWKSGVMDSIILPWYFVM